MKCQQCSAAEATVHIKTIKNDKVTELHLCEGCAKERGFHSMVTQGKSSLANQIIWMAEKLYPAGSEAISGVQCSHCGLTYSDFLSTGRLGCEVCYRDFEKQLKQILRKIHGSVRHTGKAPGKEGDQFERRRMIQKLHEDLERAIEREEYELAAEIRDRIRNIETPEAAPNGAGAGGRDQG